MKQANSRYIFSPSFSERMSLNRELRAHSVYRKLLSHTVQEDVLPKLLKQM